MTTDPVLRPFRRRPDRSGIFADFDGSLSAIVDQPADAVPIDGVVEVLSKLAARYGVVAITSGRPVSFLAALFPDPALRISGLYGLEARVGGARDDHPSAGAWREVIDDVVAQSEAFGPSGMVVESKGLSITLHYRTSPDLADDVAAWAERQANRSGLRVQPAKMSVELNPPIDADKGTTVEALAEGLSNVFYLGDDRGDLAAFDALDRMAAKGLTVLRAAVGSDEAPAELLERADLVVDSPQDAVELLRQLV